MAPEPGHPVILSPMAPSALLATLLVHHAAAGSALPDLVATPARTGATSPQDAAVVVGVEDYADLQDVPFAARDAEAFRSFLVYTRGLPQDAVQTLVSSDGHRQVSQERLHGALQAAAARGAQGTVWVFYSGHGVADPKDPSERILLGDDAKPDPDSMIARGIRVSEVRRLASARGARVILVIDACYTGAARDGSALVPGSHWALPVAPASSSIPGLEWDAAGPDQLSNPLPAVGQGAFSYFATGALRGWADGELSGVRDGQVTAQEAQAYVVRMVTAAGLSTQAPMLLGQWDAPLSAGQEQGPSEKDLQSATGTVVTGGTSADLQALARAAEQARRMEQEAKKRNAEVQKATERAFAEAMAPLQAQAAGDWQALASLCAVKDGASIPVVEAFLARYAGLQVTVAGETRPVPIPEVVQAQKWLGRGAGTALSQTFQVGGQRFTLVGVGAGSYRLECGGRYRGDDVRDVALGHAFQVGETEVTRALWTEVMGAPPRHTECDACPVVKVTWCDAVIFLNHLSVRVGLPQAYVLPEGLELDLGLQACNQAAEKVRLVAGSDGFRLPTELEWQVAARAGSPAWFCGSDTAAPVAWYDKNAEGRLHPVATREPNGWGIHDTCGNAAEMCWNYDSALCTDVPLEGPSPDSTRGVRGGSYQGSESSMNVMSRERDWPGACWDADVGFRLARTLP